MHHHQILKDIFFDLKGIFLSTILSSNILQDAKLMSNRHRINHKPDD